MEKDINRIENSNPTLFMDSIIMEVKKQIKKLLESLLFEELTSQLHTKKYQRTKKRRGYFNGYWEKSLYAKDLGRIYGLKVPRSRHSLHKMQAVSIYQANAREINNEIIRGFIFGVDHTKINEVIGDNFSNVVPKSRAWAAAISLRTSIKSYRERIIREKYRYLILDTVWVAHKSEQHEVLSPLYLAMGVAENGQQEIVGSQLFEAETTQGWDSFLEQLKTRGFNRQGSLQLIVYGSIYELKKVLEDRFPGVLKQRCLNNKLTSILDERNLQDPDHQSAINQELLGIFSRHDREEIQSELKDFIKRWKDAEPRISQFVEEDLNCIFNYLSMPKAPHSIPRTTALVRPLFHEIEKRADVVTFYRNIGVKREDFFDSSVTRLSGE